MQNQWTEWLAQNNLPPEELMKLEVAIKDRLGDQDAVRVIRPAVQDKMVLECGPYLDVHRLIPLYEALQFRENLLVKGPKGDGKSLSFFYYAYHSRIPLIVVECSENHHKRDFIGSFYLQGRETPFILGDIPTAIDIANEYGKAILLFEEINSLTPQTQKQLNGLLDFRQSVNIPQIGRNYKLTTGQLWVTATMNPSVYGGTYELNDDLRSRLDECEVGYPSTTDEENIVWANLSQTPSEPLKGVVKQIIRVANETRKKSVGYALSTRDIVRFIRDYLLLGLEQACQLLVCKFENDDRDTMRERITSHFKGVYPKKTWGSGGN